MVKHDKRARSHSAPSSASIGHETMVGTHAAKRFQKMNGPPKGEPWTWISREMMESEAWSKLTLVARRVIDRILIEHMAQGGNENGRLIVTYDDFEKYGIRRQSIPKAIGLAVTLGLIDVTARGKRSAGTSRRPSMYALTWLPRHDWTPPSNRWKSTTPCRTIEGRCNSAPRENGRNPSAPGAKTHPEMSNNAPGIRCENAPRGKNFDLDQEGSQSWSA